MKLTFKRISKSTLSVVLAIMMVISTMLIGTFTVSASTEVTVYLLLNDSNWKNNSYKYYANNNTKTGWTQTPMENTNTTMNGSAVYKATFTAPTDVVYNLQFQVYEGTTWKFQVEPYNSETNVSTFNNKCWDALNNQWIEYTPDAGGGTGGGAVTGDLYLVGTINNKDVSGTEYKFVDDKITLKITSRSYVNVRTAEGTEYKTKGWHENLTSQVLYSDGNNKLDVNNIEGNVEFTVGRNEDGTLTLSYAAATTPTSHTITYATVDNVTAVPTAGSAAKDESVVINATDFTVNANYTITNLTVTKTGEASTTVEVTKNGDTYSFTMPDYDVTVTPTVVLNTYTVSYATPDGISSAPSSASYGVGDTVTISGYNVTSGYTITGYTVTKTGDPSTTVDVTKSGDTYSFTMPDYGVTVTPTVTSTTPTEISFALVDDGYGLIGASTYSDSTYKLNYNADTQEYTTTVEYSSTSKKNWFLIMDNSGNYYGTSSTSSKNIEENTSSTNTFTLVKSKKQGSGGVYPLYFRTNKTYTIHVKQSGANYVAWVTTGDTPTPSGGNYYIGGAFQIYDPTRTTRKATDTSNWKVDSTAISFTAVSGTENLYKLETYSTISELAEKYGGRTSDTYFLIHNGNGTYYQTTETKSFNDYSSSSNAITLSSSNSNTEKYLYFTEDATNTGYVTLYLDTSNGYKLYYTAEAAPITKAVTIYAKDGTTDKGESGGSTPGGTALFGETKVGTYGADGKFAENTGTDYNGDCRKYSVTVSEEEAKPVLTVQTTVDPTYYSNGDGYYVAGFVINGATYAATDKGKGVYETEYTVDGTVPKVEITPVYFSKAIEAAGDYMTFYFDASELPAKTWGEPITVGVYSYYYTGEVDNDKKPIAKMQDGSWPGQPMLKDASGTLWTKVSKKFYGSATKATNYGISGLVLNNYAPDPVHREVTNLTANNVQTYDYNDIVVASNAGYDTIRFESKYRTAKVYNGESSFYKDGNVLISSFNPEDELYANGWTEFTYYDKTVKTDILGNPVQVNAEGTPTKDPIYIVSVGEINDSSVGEHATKWYVYAKDGSGNYALVTSGFPSDFIKRAEGGTNTPAYAAMNVDTYKGSPTYITYEGQNDIKGTNRSDGRWYYIDSSTTKATIKMGVQIKDGDSWVDGINGTDGTATIGDNNEFEKTYTLNETALINAIPPLNYVFDSWAIDYTGEGNYTTMDLDTPSGEIKISNNATIVARFVPIASGNLVIAHSAYPGSALAYYYVSATLTKADDTNEIYTNSTSSITFKNINANDKTIAITLKTRPGGINEFEAFYQRFGDAYFPLVTKDDTDVITKGEDGTVSYSFTVDVADLFTTDQKVQMISALSFYSNVSEKSADVTLKYIYDDRDNNPKTYIATDKLNDKYIEDHPDYSLNNEDGKVIIYKNAPYIQDLYKNCTWVITDQTATYSGTTVTLKAVQTVKTYTVTISDAYANGGVDVERRGIAYNSFLCDNSKISSANPKGLDVLAQGDKFLYWSVTKSIDNVTKEIARTTSQYFDLRIIEDCTITAVYEGQNNPTAYISEPTYTREQYTENGVKYDYVYADFNLAYSTPDGKLIRDNPDNYKTGIIVELDKSATTEGNNTSSFTETSTEALKNITELAYGTRGFTTEDKNRIAYNYVIEKKTLFNNRNRLDYYLKYNNTPGNRKYIMRAYFYVIDPSGTITISAPVYFRFDDIGTTVVKNPNNTETTA